MIDGGLGTPSIRDVIAFPKTSSGNELLTGSPAGVAENIIAEMGLKFGKNIAQTSESK
jgi:aspartyl-tRNA synthetase